MADIPPSLFDMHCHLDFWKDPARIAHEAAALGIGAFTATVSSAAYESARKTLAPCKNVRVGAGMHPWWVADGRVTHEDVKASADLARETRFIGEIGLDFGKRCLEGSIATDDETEAGGRRRRPATVEEAKALQVEAFSRVLKVCATEGGRILSIHAVKSADTVLDLLERMHAIESCTCILHWFSGSSQELARAIKLGCRFSFGTRSLATRKGREYVKAVPIAQLLLETDWPPATGYEGSADEWIADLRRAAEGIAALRGEDALERITESSRRLLGV